MKKVLLVPDSFKGTMSSQYRPRRRWWRCPPGLQSAFSPRRPVRRESAAPRRRWRSAPRGAGPPRRARTAPWRRPWTAICPTLQTWRRSVWAATCGTPPGQEPPGAWGLPWPRSWVDVAHGDDLHLRQPGVQPAQVYPVQLIQRAAHREAGCRWGLRPCWTRPGLTACWRARIW